MLVYSIMILVCMYYSAMWSQHHVQSMGQDILWHIYKYISVDHTVTRKWAIHEGIGADLICKVNDDILNP